MDWEFPLLLYLATFFWHSHFVDLVCEAYNGIFRNLVLLLRSEEAMVESTQLWTDYISLDLTYQELRDLKERGWSNGAGDTFFQNRRRAAKNLNQKGKEGFYKMTRQIGEGLASKTGIFNLQYACPKVLDLCMAPGGFTATAAKKLPGSLIDAVTLPCQIGGYEVMAKEVCRHIIYADITMYSKETGYDEKIPTGHPDSNNFETCQPFLGDPYDIVICGGAVGKDHPRESYRSDCEGKRLTVSQLVFAMNRLKPGGSVILLLHRVESWDTVCILNAFSEFSDIQLYKHPKFHAIKSSFYLVAKNVNLEHDAAQASISYWKSLWKHLTFKEFIDIPLPLSSFYRSDYDFVQKLRDKFGPQFLTIARPLWEIQAKALRKAPFTQKIQHGVAVE